MPYYLKFKNVTSTLLDDFLPNKGIAVNYNNFLMASVGAGRYHFYRYNYSTGNFSLINDKASTFDAYNFVLDNTGIYIVVTGLNTCYLLDLSLNVLHSLYAYAPNDLVIDGNNTIHFGTPDGVNHLLAYDIVANNLVYRNQTTVEGGAQVRRIARNPSANNKLFVTCSGSISAVTYTGLGYFIDASIASTWGALRSMAIYSGAGLPYKIFTGNTGGYIRIVSWDGSSFTNIDGINTPVGGAIWSMAMFSNYLIVYQDNNPGKVFLYYFDNSANTLTLVDTYTHASNVRTASTYRGVTNNNSSAFWITDNDYLWAADLNYDYTVNFSATPVTGNINLTVQFQDTSTGLPASQWLWDFGDGSTSTSQNPSHIYTHPGRYTVSLTTMGFFNETKVDYIEVKGWNLDFSGDNLSGPVKLKTKFTPILEP